MRLFKRKLLSRTFQSRPQGPFSFPLRLQSNLGTRPRLKAHLHPNGLATVCYCFQMVLLFFSRSDWLPEYSCERENCHVNSKQIGGAMSHRFTLRSCPNLRPQFTNLWVFLQVPEHIVLLLYVRHCNLVLFWS